MTLIDLGDIATGPAAPASFPVNLRRLRRSLLAVLAVAGLVALTASTPARALVRPLWMTAFRPSDTLALDGRTLFVNRAGDAVTAYDLRSGRPRWSVPSSAAVATYGVDPAGGVLLVHIGPVDDTRATQPWSSATIALDAVTGKQLWRSEGEAVASAASGDAVLAETDQYGVTTGLRLVALADGHQIWEQAIPPAVQWTTIEAGGRPTTIVAVTGTGDATSYRYGDGAVLSRAHIPWNGVYSASMSPAGPYLVVVRTASAQTVATVYRAADLSRLWVSDELIGYVTGCGGLICTAGVRGVVGREPATGRELWRRSDMNFVWDLGGGRLLLSAAADLASATTTLVDAGTGRTIGRPFGGQQSFATGTAGSLLLLRANRSPAGRTVMTRLDLADGQQTVLGVLNQIADQDCRGAAGYLLCRRDDKLTVTAVG